MEKLTSNKYTIKQIFQDHWQGYLTKHPEVPEYVKENVRKMLDCRNPKKMGYAKMACPDHPECYTVIPHSCKSRFCNSCGKIAVDNWLTKACSVFPNVPYIHLTFTIPSELREVFLSNPEQRNLLFKVSSSIIIKWARNRGWKPAIVCVLHTFGRDLKFHPHIHMLVSAGGIDSKTEKQWIECEYIPQEMIKKRWKTRLLRVLHDERLISRRMRRNLFFFKWYVYIENELLIPNITANYVGRYTKRPPLAEARIINYDRKTVTFIYEDWYLNRMQREMILEVEDFITRLIQHIPPKYFMLIKYYGILHQRTKSKYSKIVRRLFGKIKTFLEKTSWRIRQKMFRGKDVLRCPKCQKEMKLMEIAFWSTDLERLCVNKVI